MRANLGYPPAPSYAEMGKQKPIKKGRNQKSPRPFRDVKVFKCEKNRAERRAE